LGNLRTALLAWLSARAAGLRTIVRVEDLEPGASPPGVADAQLDDLAWLGLEFDEGPREGGPVGPYRQSERSSHYRRALEALNAQGLLYPCWCSRKEVLAATRAPHASDEGPIYPGTCRPAFLAPLADLDDLPRREGRRPALRVSVAAALEHAGYRAIDHTAIAPEEGVICLTDALSGRLEFRLGRDLGDFVVRRADGVAAYQLACAWDDYAMGCTLVVRGSDLLPSAARQALLLRALDLEVPRYAHVGLVLTATGERLAKRDGGHTLAELRQRGATPRDVVRLLAALSGLPPADTAAELVPHFSLERLSAAPVHLANLPGA
jgi:glutamyl-tRNA synthetase